MLTRFIQLLISEKTAFRKNFKLLIGTKGKFEFGAVLMAWDMWYNTDSWPLMPKAMFSRCLLLIER